MGFLGLSGVVILPARRYLSASKLRLCSDHRTRAVAGTPAWSRAEANRLNRRPAWCLALRRALSRLGL